MLEEEHIKQLKKEIGKLKNDLQEKELLLRKLERQKSEKCIYNEALSTEEVVRYSRQMLIPQLSVGGQAALKRSKVLIVGAGGLGCPASLYLAGAGVGEITIIDYDAVELSNLHRQILHTEQDIGLSKVQSAYNKLHSINGNISIIPINKHLDSSAINELIKRKKFDVVVDGSDNVATRYLLNDCCVINNIPLVSGSALQLEGQLTVYHYKGGPCYRCLFPVPPPAHTVTNCGDGGVLGPVPGTIGVLQALETIKILTSSLDVLSGRLLLFDGSSTTFRNVKLRGKSSNCAVCGEDPTVRKLIDYEQFCGASAHDKVINIDILKPEEQVSVRDFAQNMNDKLIVDVRPEVEYKMCKLDNTINLPYLSIEKGKGLEGLQEILKAKNHENSNVYVLCRRGNDSQRSVVLLKQYFLDVPVRFCNVKGGLHAYSKNIDPSFPAY